MIDGRLNESAWAGARAYRLDRRDQVHPGYRDGWGGPQDLSATLRVLQSGDDIVLGIEVRDDAPGQTGGPNWWSDDSIEVFLDSDLAGDAGEERFSDDDRQLFLLPFHDGLRWGVWSRGPGLPYPDGGLRGIEVASLPIPGGYAVEARLPLWAFPKLNPDARRRIGFDLALNDRDPDGPACYMSLSGRFDLYRNPTRFARLRLAKTEQGAAGGASGPPTDVDWTGLLLGLAGVMLLALAARRLVRGLTRAAAPRVVLLCGLFAAGGALLLALPRLAEALDDAAVRDRWESAVDAMERAAANALVIDTGDTEDRARRLLALLRDGSVDVRPGYSYTCLPVTPEARKGPAEDRSAGPFSYKIPLAPGELRRFPLLGHHAAAMLRADLATGGAGAPGREASDAPAALLRLEFNDAEPLERVVTAEETGVILLDTRDHTGFALRALEVRNLLRSGTLDVNAVYERSASGPWQPLPLATPSDAGVPFDIWHGRPRTFLLEAPPSGVAVVPAGSTAADRCWIALYAEGAYPRSTYGAEVAALRAVYRDGAPGPELRLVNGRDLADHLLAYARRRDNPASIAQQWESEDRKPAHYTLHALDLDPGRALDHIEVRDLGVLGALYVAAATIGRRAAPAPAPSSGLRLEQNRLSVRDDVRRTWAGAGFSLRIPGGGSASAGPAGPVGVERVLAFGPHDQGTLRVRLPRGEPAATLLRHRSAIFGGAVLLFAFAGLLAGAALLRRARHLRVKMLVALGAASLVPLAFLVVSLTRDLHERVEHDLREATLADLRGVLRQLDAARARARELALGVRDTLEIAGPAPGRARLAPLISRCREDVEVQGGFLRLPGLDPPRPSPLGNVSLIDTARRSGLLESAWDGLLALGIARTAGGQECVVGLPARSLVAEPLPAGVRAVLFAPGGEPLAETGAVPALPRTTASRAAVRGLVQRLRRTGRPYYESRTSLRAGYAAAYDLVREGARVVGMAGVHRSRAEARRAKASILRTVLLSSLAALLLVVLAGGTLVERVAARLQRVTRAARALAAGGLESRVPIEADDEVGRLAQSFNSMADALGERMDQLTALHRGLHELTSALDRAAVGRAATALIARTTGARHVTVAALERATDRLEVLDRQGEGPPLGPRLETSGPAREAVESNALLLRGNALFLPLLAGDRPVGLAVASPLAAADLAGHTYLEACGRQIGIALENARLYHAAVTDEPTGLYTEAFLVRRLREEVDRAAATGRSVSVLRLVVEDFRKLARAHGAAAATRLLREVATVAEEVLPRRDILAHRHDGELLALLVESDERQARRSADRIAAALRSHEFAAPAAGGTRPRVTYRHVSFPRDGAAADILLDALHEFTESWDEHAEAADAPALRVPARMGVVLGRSAAMRQAAGIVARVAPTTATVLLSGETGSGKEVLADLIHLNSDRRDGPYVKLNCAAIPETLIEAELFGHERGAFTGAERRRIGCFERAHRGTLFLDEIGELPLPLQVTLLRVLQERRLQRVGGSDPVEVDVRILAASNRDLTEAARRGAFREDLYHRIRVIELHVPSLRERREDIPLLLDRFRQEFNLRHGLAVEAFTPDALDALYRHPWPGNVRELRNVVERSMLLAGGSTVDWPQLALPRAESAAKPAPPRIEGLTPRQERILERARTTGGVTNGDVVRTEQVSARTALRELQRLVERGLLVRVGRRRGAVYRTAT